MTAFHLEICFLISSRFPRLRSSQLCSTLSWLLVTFSETIINCLTGVYKVPYNLIFFPTPIFKSCFAFFSPLEILPNSPNIIGQMILLPFFSFFHVIFFPKPWYSPPLYTTWYFSPGEGGWGALYTPVVQSTQKDNQNNENDVKAATVQSMIKKMVKLQSIVLAT